MGTFSDHCSEYRIKPEPVKTAGYRRYVYKYPHMEGYRVLLAHTPDLVTEAEKQKHFVHWIDTEWQYHEVEGVEE